RLVNPSSITEDLLKEKFTAIEAVNTQLLEQNLPCIIVSVRKSKKGEVRHLHQELCSLPEMTGMKLILYVEHTVNAKDLPVALWRFCNNLDPKRDHFLYEGSLLGNETGKWACMGLDGTIKTLELDDFKRDWPNIIVAARETIESVDGKWDKLGIGSFLPSPSLKFQDQLYGEDAVAAPK
ncbi:MAG TPA: menaquinone biosynthesis decarboxylase, partial [Chitinophagaceae bacterium]|nr:menaquinone biosynthesis decarboxylase [Chitinophagaceae bacterium]